MSHADRLADTLVDSAVQVLKKLLEEAALLGAHSHQLRRGFGPSLHDGAIHYRLYISLHFTVGVKRWYLILIS